MIIDFPETKKGTPASIHVFNKEDENERSVSMWRLPVRVHYKYIYHNLVTKGNNIKEGILTHGHITSITKHSSSDYPEFAIDSEKGRDLYSVIYKIHLCPLADS